MDDVRFVEVKKELQNTEKDLSKALDLTFATKSPGPSTILSMLEETVVISGSCIYNMYHKIQATTKGTDIDFYFRNPESKEAFENMFASGGFPFQERDYMVDEKKKVLSKGPKSFEFKLGPLFPSLNFIYYHDTQIYKDLYEDIMTYGEFNFIQMHDFMHTCAVYDLRKDELIMPKGTAEAIVNKSLVVNPRYAKMLVASIKSYEELKAVPGNSVPSQSPDVKPPEIQCKPLSVGMLRRSLIRYNKFMTREMIPDTYTAGLYRRIASILPPQSF